MGPGLRWRLYETVRGIDPSPVLAVGETPPAVAADQAFATDTNDIPLFETARQALFLAWARRVRVRHLRLVCDRLVFPPAQLALFGGDRQQTEKRDRLISTLDAVRHRFGGKALQVGRTLAA